MGYSGVSSGRWRYAKASVIGTSHEKTSIPCQDRVFCDVFRLQPSGEELLAAFVSDGAGSASRAEVGAALACATFCDLVSSNSADEGTEFLLSDSFPFLWLKEFQNRVAQIATDEGISTRDFACTAVAVLAVRHTATFFQIGDGAIVLSAPGDPDYGLMFWPDRGEYENVTHFATQIDAADHLQALTGEAVSVEEVAVFSDGLQRLALNYNDRSAHTPFFSPLFTFLRNSAEGECSETSDALSKFLSSSRVNARTDDDKSLILATRRIAPLEQLQATTE